MAKFYLYCWNCECEFIGKHPNQELCGICIPTMNATGSVESMNSNPILGTPGKLIGFRTKAELDGIYAEPKKLKRLKPYKRGSEELDRRPKKGTEHTGLGGEEV